MIPASQDTTKQDVQNLFNDLEKDLLDHIISNMQHREISTDEAQKLAQGFLSLLPSNDKKELLKKLNALAAKYPQAKETYVKYAVANEKEEKEKALHEMSLHIKAGNIEQAISVAKGANQ